MPVPKTTQMLLIEARDPQGRDIRQIIQALVDETGTVAGAAKALELDPAVLSRWINKFLKGDVRSRVIFPDFTPEREAVAS